MIPTERPNDFDAEVLLAHCALRVTFAERALESVIAEICGTRCATCVCSPGQQERWESIVYGRMTDLLPMMIRLHDALAERITTALRIGVRLGSRPLLANLTIEPEPD